MAEMAGLRKAETSILARFASTRSLIRGQREAMVFTTAQTLRVSFACCVTQESNMGSG